MSLVTERRSQTRLRHGERGIWQRHYWEHLIRDEQDSPYGLRPYQPAQAWLCHAGGRLAVFHLPSLRSEWRLSAELVRVGGLGVGGIGVNLQRMPRRDRPITLR